MSRHVPSSGRREQGERLSSMFKGNVPSKKREEKGAQVFFPDVSNLGNVKAPEYSVGQTDFCVYLG